MGLRATLETTEGLAPEIAALYTKTEDGKFALEVDGLVGKDKLDEFRNNNVSLLKQLEAFKGIDPAKAKEAAELERKVREKELIDKGDIDGIVTERVKGIVTDYDTKVQGLTEKLSTTEAQLGVLLIDRQVAANALKHSVLPEAADDVMLRAKSIFKIVDGKAVAMNGDKMVYGKDGVTPLTVDEWVKGLQTSAPHLFKSSTGSGSKGGMRVGGVDTSTMSAKDKIAMALSQQN
jgi:hypothetical protein